MPPANDGDHHIVHGSHDACIQLYIQTGQQGTQQRGERRLDDVGLLFGLLTALFIACLPEGDPPW